MKKAVLLCMCLGACSNGPGVMDPDMLPAGEATALHVRSGRDGTSLEVPPVLERGALVFRVPGFLSLRTWRRSGDVWLWPDDQALPVRYTSFLVYDDKEQGLRRLPANIRSVAVVPDTRIRGNPSALEALERATELFSARNETVTYILDGTNADMVVPFSVDPNDDTFKRFPGAGAVAHLFINGRSVITRAEVVVRGLDTWHGWDNFMVGMAHELVHVHGLLHLDPDGPQGIMSSRAASYEFRDFTEAEQLVIAMHDRRSAGTRLNGTDEYEAQVRGFSTDSNRVIIID